MASTQHTAAAPSAGRRARIRSRSNAPSALARGAPSAFAGAVACVLALALAWRQGGYFAESFVNAGAAAFVAVAVVLVVRPPYYRLSTSALVAVSALASLAVWTALSSRWSSAPDVALEDFERDLLYLAVLGLGLLAAGSGRYSRHMLWVVLALLVAITGAGLLSRVQPDWVSPAGTLSHLDDGRLAYPLGYWNGLGVLGAMGVVLGAGLAANPRSAVVLRALAAGAVVVLATAGYLSFSRGAWLAFFVGVAVLVAISAHRPSLLLTLGICGLGSSVAIARLASYPAITNGPGPGSNLLAQGDAYFPFLVTVVVLVALAQVVASGHWLPRDLRAVLVRRARLLGVAAGVLAAIGAAGFYVVKSGEVEGQSASRLQRASDWVDHQWDEFMAPAVINSSGSRRLTSARGTRSDLYRVAIDGFQAHPLWGDGSGSFEYRFAHDRKVAERVRDAHSLYLETLGELGLVGVIALLGFVGAVIWAAAVARRRGGTLAGAQAAAGTAAFAVWAAHTGVDWDWQLPAVTIPALLLGAALFPQGRGRRTKAPDDFR